MLPTFLVVASQKIGSASTKFGSAFIIERLLRNGKVYRIYRRHLEFNEHSFNNAYF